MMNDMKNEIFRSGFISIIGRPNVGKSTLLNAILGEKIAIVSAKPQTTRNSIRGVYNGEASQLVFIDTPGMHRSDKPLNKFMIKEALGALSDVDLILYMIDALTLKDATNIRKGTDDDFILESLKNVKSPVMLVINKVDKVRKEELLPIIDMYSKAYNFKSIIPLSALNSDGIDELIGEVTSVMPEGPEYFPPDIVTDQPERFIAAEIIREKIFRMTKQEIPYSVAVVIEEFKERKKKDIVDIRAAINVERDSQKGIVIGKHGAMLKAVGSAAREDLEGLLGVKVFLELFVRVSKDWTKSEGRLREFGYK